MAGVKGRSGRKSWDKEIESKEIWQLSTAVLKFALKSDQITISKKAEIAVSIFNKMVPNHNINEQFGELNLNIAKESDYQLLEERLLSERRCSVN